MAFYSAIAQNYDYIFPLNSAQLKFTMGQMSDGGENHILDVGCGTGSLAMALDRDNCQVVGIDLDEEMIQLAKEKDLATVVDFRVANMLTLEEVFPREMFSMLTCYGNTLVHLGSDEKVRHFLESAYHLLKTGGKLLLQIINYDRIIDQNIKSLPTINNEHVVFKREYERSVDKTAVRFITELTIKGSGDKVVNSVPLLALRKSLLEDLLRDVGFKKLSFFGGFDMSESSAVSQPLVAVAIK